MPAPKKPQKKKNRRENVKNPGLKKGYNLKTRQDLLDQDYIGKLNDKEKAWLNSFNEEFVNANFNHAGKVLHKTKKLRKDCYNRNNSRNRDVLTRTKASGMLQTFGQIPVVEDNYDLNFLDAREILEEKLKDFDPGLNGAKNSKNPTKKKD